MEMVAIENTIAVVKSAYAVSACALSAMRSVEQREQHGHAEHGENADARHGAVRRADQARHVAADRGDDRADQEHVDERRADDERRVGGDRPAGGEPPQEGGDWHERRQDRAADNANRQVALGELPAPRRWRGPPTRPWRSECRATIGPMILRSVQMAAMPIVPAPMKRTWLRNTPLTVAATSGPTPCIEVSHGTSTAQEVSMPTSMAMPTVMPTRWPTPISAIDRLVDAPLAADPPRRNAVANSPAASFIAASSAKPAEAREPATIAASPLAFSSAPPTDPEPTLNTSAAATPSGYGRSDPVTSARLSGTENITPNVPPIAQTATVVQYGKPCHQPIITRPGSTKMMAASVPAADAMVWTMLFSRMVDPRTKRRMAIEITAAGIDVANVMPTFSPR